MVKFRCDADGCPNKGVDYIWADAAEELALCGGCGAILEAING